MKQTGDNQGLMMVSAALCLFVELVHFVVLCHHVLLGVHSATFQLEKIGLHNSHLCLSPSPVFLEVKHLSKFKAMEHTRYCCFHSLVHLVKCLGKLSGLLQHVCIINL